MNIVGNATYEIVGDSLPPRRAYHNDAGLDLAIQEDTVIKPGQTVYARAGLKFNLPPSYAVHVITRSSTFRRGVVVIPTIIDSGYTGEISTIITNQSDKCVTIEKGAHLAQAILVPCYAFANEITEGNVERNDSKTGSSGS